ncbi:MAG: hypothetical protein U5K51_15860 [Flavobacteriaceae bacterium]|nr:hypothetical protein [Flavobacteriaceae bacterium]
MAGTIGYEINDFSQIYLGKPGVFLILFFTLLLFFILYFKLSPQNVKNLLPKKKEGPSIDINDTTDEGYIAEAIHENTDKSHDFAINKKNRDIGNVYPKIEIEEAEAEPEMVAVKSEKVGEKFLSDMES